MAIETCAEMRHATGTLRPPTKDYTLSLFMIVQILVNKQVGRSTLWHSPSAIAST